MHPDFLAERERAEFVLEFLRGYLKEVSKKKADIDEQVTHSLKHFNMENVDQFIELTMNTNYQEYYTRKQNETQKALEKPYFARVDFFADDEAVWQQIYIGKMMLTDKDDNILITDWRAPVSTLYYEGRIGRASYECIDGEIEGEIRLKRQYNFESGELLAISDVDITTNDTFLQAALSGMKDRRLRDIVTTIQAEQNRIIRSGLYQPLIVQGVAGSGKTTIALHRIAYLLYTYEKKINAKQYMIMAPNRFFLSYISDVLPDLGVESVPQCTFEDFANEYIIDGFSKKKLNISPSVNLVAHVINNHLDINTYPPAQAAALKSTLRYKQVIIRFCSHTMKQIVPKEDFAIEEFVLITKRDVRNLLLKEYSYLPFAKRVIELRKNLSSTLKRRKPIIIEELDKLYDRKKEEIKRLSPDSEERREVIDLLLKERDERITRVKNKSKVMIAAYLKQFETKSPVEYYIDIFRSEKMFNMLCDDVFDEDETKLIFECTRADLMNQCLQTEDLPPMMLIRQMINGQDALDARHLVIDEAQDYSMFQMSVLKDILKSGSFSILGDLNQGIYSYKGIRDWNELIKDVFGEESIYMTMEQSYRTTIEIMEAANNIISRLRDSSGGYNPLAEIPLAKPVIRHGEPVVYSNLTDYAELADDVEVCIDAYKKEGFQSFAIIIKTMDGCKAFRDNMKSSKTKPPILTGAETEYGGGTLIIPSYLVKGLEFDAVFIIDASSENYTDNELDTKLLYIAMTRALHRLHVYGSNA